MWSGKASGPVTVFILPSSVQNLGLLSVLSTSKQGDALLDVEGSAMLWSSMYLISLFIVLRLPSDTQ